MTATLHKCATGLLLAATLTVAAAPAAAQLSLVFQPNGSVVDADEPLDVVTSVGDSLTFTMVLDTRFINITSIDYSVRFDPSELELTTAAVNSDSFAVNVAEVEGDTIDVSHGTRRPGPLGIGDQLTFRVLSGLNNDGDIDFEILSAGTNLANAVRLQSPVSVQPVPEPAALGLLALGVAGVAAGAGRRGRNAG
jgi:hypothetical protein